MNTIDLVRLCYASEAQFNNSVEGSVETEVGRILLQSRRNNPKCKVGGVLYYGNGFFFQCLEGPRSAVEATYNRISKDHRHQGVRRISLTPVKRRLFSNWSMKYVAVETAVAEFLKKNQLQSFQPLKFSNEHIEEILLLFANVPSQDRDRTTTASNASAHKASWFRKIFSRKQTLRQKDTVD